MATGLFGNVVDWMRSPERTQQLQGLGNYLGAEGTGTQGMLNAAALATAPVPVVGDVLGLASDAYRMYENPDQRTPLNYGLAAAGALPFIPAGGILSKTVSTLPPASNAQKTQIIGTLPTYEKAKAILDREVGAEGKTLDFGAGLGEGAKVLKADTYEPFPRTGFNPNYLDSSKIPSNSYEKITNFNVLNVVPREIRDTIVSDIGRVLKPGGTAIITTRGKDVMGAKGAAGPEPMSIITSAQTYQKGFTNKELKEYIKETLGDQFEVTNLKLGPAGVLIKKKNPEIDLFADSFASTIK